MRCLGSAKLIGVVHTFWPNGFTDLDKPAIWERGVESMKTLSKTAADLGVTLGLEVVNRFESHILNTAAEAVRFCKDIKVWRDLGGGGDEATLDANIGKSLQFLKAAFAK